MTRGSASERPWKKTTLVGTDADGALNATTVVNTLAVALGGASILRVHDVRECVEMVRIYRQTMAGL